MARWFLHKRFLKDRRFWLALGLCVCLLVPVSALAEGVTLPTLTVGLGEAEGPQQVSVVLKILGLLTVLSLAPAILLLTTSFTRLAVVFAFMRQALGTQHMPPNQVMLGLALFMTFFIMTPTFTAVNQNALQPYLNEEIDETQALDKALEPVRAFMLNQTREKDLALFLKISGAKKPKNQSEVPTLTLIPAFVISELKTAFIIGFVLYIPFLIIDMVVASVLLSMGMMMLPPVMISLPFKLMLFVLVDGWNLIIGSLLQSFAKGLS